MKLIRYLWRIFKWWFKCLWAGKVLPRVEKNPYSRSYMRKVWADRLREIDRQVNFLTVRGKPLGFLLMERKIMVSKRRRFLFE